MDVNLAQSAISLALNGKWKEAIAVNKKILKTQKDDIDALNRLARACAEIGKTTQARQNCEKVLKIDPSNQIAQKAITRYKSNRKNGQGINDKSADASTFLEEPGKTKIVGLLNPGDSKLIMDLSAGDEARLTTHSHRACVVTMDGKYIGRLPDDLAARLKTLVKGGNQYRVFIKSIEKKVVKVFLKESCRGKDFINTPSFPSEKIEYISYAPPELVNKQKPDMSTTEEESDSF